MSDRERLEALAQANEQKRRDEESARKQMEAENAERHLQQRASDEEQTEAIFRHCKSVFQGFKLKPTGQDVQVDKAPASRVHGIRSDGHDYVCMSISHWGSETHDFDGLIPVVMTRCYQGEYQVSDHQGRMKVFTAFDDLKEHLIQLHANMDRDAMKKLFATVRGQVSGR
jgi:hypothetical protein